MPNISSLHRAVCTTLLVCTLAACGQATPAPTATPTAPAPTPTVAATATEPLPTASPTVEVTPTATPPQEPTATATVELSPTPTLTPTEAVPLTNRAEFVADVTVPDGTVYKTNTPFVKTWRLKNVGTATWTPAYQLVFVKGEALTTTKSVPLTGMVGPGEMIDVSIAMTTPATTGRRQSFWQLQTPTGELFGIGPEANVPIYTDIWVVVAQGTSSGAPIQIKSAALSVPQAAVTAPCPYELVLRGTLGTNNGSGRVTMQLNATFSDPNYKFTPPDQVELNFAGTEVSPFPIAYTLTFASSMSVAFELRIITPNDVRSTPVNFSLTCSN